MEPVTIAILVVVGAFLLIAVIATLAVVFRRRLTPLLEDYAVDFALSTIALPLGGFLGFDVGDLLAAIIIFFRERKATNDWIAAQRIP